MCFRCSEKCAIILLEGFILKSISNDSLIVNAAYTSYSLSLPCYSSSISLLQIISRFFTFSSRISPQFCQIVPQCVKLSHRIYAFLGLAFFTFRDKLIFCLKLCPHDQTTNLLCTTIWLHLTSKINFS